MVKEEGRELDVEVAKKILGLQVWFDSGKNDWMCYHPKQPNRKVILPNYSTNTNHAYRIINELHSKNLLAHIGSSIVDGNITWKATFFEEEDKKLQPSLGKSLAHAICLAALAVLDGSNVIHFPQNKS